MLAADRKWDHLKYLPGSLIFIAIIESDLLFVCKINHEILILFCPAFGRVGLKSMEDKKQVYFINMANN